MDDKDFCYPSIGELVRVIFNSTGLLPTKGKSSLLSGAEKKSLQMQLKRLADENSKIDGKLDELMLQLQALLKVVLIEDRLVNVFIAAINEILMVYKDCLRTEGTYLTKIDTTKYIISTSFLSRIVISFAKNFLVYNVPSLQLPIPMVLQWLLPKISTSEKVRWPLALVWEHFYTVTNTSQSQFHNPKGGDGDYRERQNLENAQRWCGGGQLPSIESLYANLEHSLSLSRKKTLELTDKQISSFKLMLFMARVSTYFFQMLNRYYGPEMICETTNYLRKFSQRVSRHNSLVWQACCEEFATLDFKTRELPFAQDYFFYDFVTFWWQRYAAITDESCHHFEHFVAQRELENINDSAKCRIYLNIFGPINTYMILEQQRINAKLIVSEKFTKMFSMGMKLKSSITDLKQADDFSFEIKQIGLWPSLAWLSYWCHANYYYRQENNIKAYQYYKDAFMHAKYRAGSNQYKLVNQYIEACAKNNQYAEMKKGVAWANYMGIEVRWLRGFDNPESEEALQALFNLFATNKMRYAIL
ncbi:hypothetical protein [Shewanella xiamenensis]|uniref:hypothetical protein n=1 Tax=Shewanella xiamenensis TaxID=332186 RepID=UPI0035B82AD8